VEVVGREAPEPEGLCGGGGIGARASQPVRCATDAPNRWKTESFASLVRSLSFLHIDLFADADPVTAGDGLKATPAVLQTRQTDESVN
jgi:hypothetical protein